VTEDKANAALAAMTTQREQGLAGVEAHYKLRKACTARAVELYDALRYETGRTFEGMQNVTFASIDKLIEDIEKDAQS
jgi:hypothetical protein